jgi:uncharacterized integral membrane protein (TIGR00698 family)
VLLAGTVALTAHALARLVLPYALAVGFEVPMAMLLGLVMVNVGGPVAWAVPGIRFAARYILGIGIILLGLRLDLQAISELGSKALWLVLFTISAGCGFALLVGGRLRVQRRVAMLIGVGCTICGNSAILAASPVVGADERETSFAVATITIVGTLAVFVLPLIGHALRLDPLSYGVWTGASVPDTAQTIASGAAYSATARDVATVVKLVRTALLAPVLLSIAWSWTRFGATVSTDAARRGARKAFPFFLIGFLALAIVRTERIIDPEQVANVDQIARACFVVALAALGLQTRMANLRVLGPRPFLLGAGTAVMLATISLPLIVAFGIGPARTQVAGSIDPTAAGTWTAVCQPGAPPALAGAFLRLGQSVPGGPGAAVGCAQLDEAGDTVQRTSRGVAKLSARTQIATFSDGRHTWTIAPGLGRLGEAPSPRVLLRARLVASGVPGAGALSPVGMFHPGGPLNDNRAFAASTRPGRVLDPTRLLVASTSNFGAPLGHAGWSAGSILSIATGRRSNVAVPGDFAATAGQAAAVGGAVRIYTSQSPGFLNRINTPSATTAALPAVAGPLDISVNNAFGRPWFANSPLPGGIGVESVTDPNGRPLADAPSQTVGGVFAGTITDRQPQRDRGSLRAGAVGTALLGASPDATGRAVFAVATADGAVEQVHVQDGVDGLAPPGTLAPLPWSAGRTGARSKQALSAGMVFNWIPDPYLYVADPGNNAIVKLHLADDFHVFHVLDIRRLQSRYLSEPIDLAPAVPEVANPAFASNTTLAGGADIYVANRGSGTIVRLRQDGLLRAAARIRVPGYGVVGSGLLNGIAVSPDARTIWVSLSSHRHGPRRISGTVVALPAFGAVR